MCRTGGWKCWGRSAGVVRWKAILFWCCSPSPELGAVGWQLSPAGEDGIEILKSVCDLASVFHILWPRSFAGLGNLVRYGLKWSSEVSQQTPAAAGSLLKGHAVQLQFDLKLCHTNWPTLRRDPRHYPPFPVCISIREPVALTKCMEIASLIKQMFFSLHSAHILKINYHLSVHR